MKQRSAAFQEKYKQLKQIFSQELISRLAWMEEIWLKLCNVSWSAEHFERLQNEAHMLAGTGSNFGYNKLTEIARELDLKTRALIEHNRVPDAKEKAEISELIEQLVQSRFEQATKEAEQEITFSETTATVSDNQRKLNLKVLIVDDDHFQLQLMAEICERFGCTVTIIDRLDALAAAIVKDMPDVILLDVVFPDSGVGGIDAARQVQKDIGFTIPVIFMSSRNDLNARMKAMQAGGVGYITKPIDPNALLTQLELVQGTQTARGKILLLDDDQAFSGFLSNVLLKHGFEVISSCEPQKIIANIEKHHPDLILLDLNMPKIRGDFIFELLKQDVKYLRLPVLFISSDTSSETQQRLLTMGASGFISKPVREEELLPSLQSALKRARSMKEMIQRVTVSDTTKPGIHRDVFFTALEEQIANVQESESPAFLISISVTNLDYLRYQVGLRYIDQLSAKIATALKDLLGDSDKLTELTPLNYLMLTAAEAVPAFCDRLHSIYQHLMNYHPQIQAQNLTLEPMVGAIRLGDKSNSVEKALRAVEAEMMKAAQLEPRVHFANDDTELQRHADKQAQVKAGLLEHKLKLVYQPVVDFETNHKIFQCFARLGDEATGVLLPQQFFPVIDELALHEHFNRELITRALADYRSLNAQQAAEFTWVLKLTMPGNSPMTFLEWLANALNLARLSGREQFIFTLSEEAIFKEQQRAKAIQAGIQKLSCGFLMEHAGTTEFTDRLIQDFGIRYVKLSQDIVQQIANKDHSALARLKKINATGAVVIAPYIETASMFAVLWDLGIRRFQGYFVAPPEKTMEFDFTSATDASG
ncbi:MAG: response regulator [Hahellaceae bacterium]|nr:response regulator [Hahellaceae bacterium]MCP5169143.1 response regulator [Hahellaceae bacterium]